MKGRKAKPTEIRLRDGTFRADRHGRPIHLAPLMEAPEAPRHLPAAARKVWDEIAPTLVEANVLQAIDLHTLEGFCMAVFHARRADALVIKQGPVAITRRGLATNPALRAARDSWTLASRFAERLGLDPASRARLGLQHVRGLSLQEELRMKYNAAKAAD